jgi:hypothetical protein
MFCQAQPHSQISWTELALVLIPPAACSPVCPPTQKSSEKAGMSHDSERDMPGIEPRATRLVHQCSDHWATRSEAISWPGNSGVPPTIALCPFKEPQQARKLES